MTNHALDSFLNDLRQLGMDRIVRLGGNSKEKWTWEYLLRNISWQMKKTTFEKSSQQTARYRVESLYTEGKSWCESLNSNELSWPAVREHLKSNYPNLLTCFTEIEHMDEARLDDIRLARKVGGFAYDFWCKGGDIHDAERLAKECESLLGEPPKFQVDVDDREEGSKYRVLDKIFLNAHAVAKASAAAEDDIWRLNLNERKALIQRWASEINPRTLQDKVAEIHRRHQLACSKRRDIYQEFDARCLAERKSFFF